MNTLNIKPKFGAKEIWVDRQPEMTIMALCPEHTWETNTSFPCIAHIVQLSIKIKYKSIFLPIGMESGTEIGHKPNRSNLKNEKFHKFTFLHLQVQRKTISEIILAIQRLRNTGLCEIIIIRDNSKLTTAKKRNTSP